ncbi:MAG: HAD hydrolase family protein [Fulvivirga sp.]|nr:HAD hydrolase family protein [Fulvivirga sp.]
MFDVDGVLTDNRVLVTEEGHLLRSMNIRDGLAIKRAVTKGYRVAIITGGRSKGVEQRLRKLGVSDIYSGREAKMEAYEDFISQHKLDPDGILYMGDDLPDYPIMRLVGLPSCPKDAAHEIRALAQYVSDRAGGDGCARDVIEKVLRLHDNWIQQ